MGRCTVGRRARPALDRAYDTALAELPDEIRPLVVEYAENVRQGQEIRSSLSTVMTSHGLRWTTVDDIARSLS